MSYRHCDVLLRSGHRLINVVLLLWNSNLLRMDCGTRVDRRHLRMNGVRDGVPRGIDDLPALVHEVIRDRVCESACAARWSSGREHHICAYTPTVYIEAAASSGCLLLVHSQ